MHAGRLENGPLCRPGLACIALALLAADPARAADLAILKPSSPPSPAATLDWSGAYVGAHFGLGLGRFDIDAAAAPGERLEFSGSKLKGWVGGFHGGYNLQFPDRVVLGLEAGLSFTGVSRGVDVTEVFEHERSSFETNVDFVAMLRGRIGYAYGPWLPYLTGGLALGRNKIDVDYEGVPLSQSRVHLGATLGAGVEFPVVGNWTGRIEYNYFSFSPETYGTLFLDDEARRGVRFDPRFHSLLLGLNYRIGDTAADRSGKDRADSEETKTDWSIHGQTTFVEQGYPRFHSPYQGAQSLPGGGQGRESWSATGFVGRRLWEGGEFYFNPELLQGFGIGNTTGLAAFPNGEAQKSSFLFPHPHVGRLFLRQTFGLGGEQESVEDGPNQIAGKRDVSRITLTVGKLAVTDIFDDNAYAHDPRTTFLNLAVWEAGAFDYPADKVGYTWGAVLELNQKQWALRAGYFLEPRESNVDVLDLHVPERGGYIVELETRYQLFSQPGKLRLIGWVNHANMGSYRETLDNPAFALDISKTRQPRFKYGGVVNIEQAISEDLGVFSRLSFNDGRTEIMSFTDIDASASLGAVLKGKSWGRPEDKIGIAGAISALSGDHRDFLAAGGLGILIGDGRLNYRPEKVLESFYAYKIDKGTTLTLDYQFFVDPAHNADRGPVSVFAARVHAEF
jgi:high affinity Mn2+ porin